MDVFICDRISLERISWRPMGTFKPSSAAKDLQDVATLTLCLSRSKHARVQSVVAYFVSSMCSCRRMTICAN